MATTFDQTLVAPTDDQLIQSLVKATRAANGRRRAGRLDKDEASWRRTVPRYRKRPSGHMQWCDAVGYDQAEVTAGWWTDRLGRKHWRVQGRRQELVDEAGLRWPFRPHGLWHVYPGRLALRRSGGREDLLAVCACGVAGAPEAIGWAGTCCGPCQDRREEGSPPALGPGFPLALAGHTASAKHLAFTPDGRHLLSGGDDGRVFLWDLTTGEGEPLLHRARRSVVAVAVSAQGRALVCLGRDLLLLGDLTPGAGRCEWKQVPGRLPDDRVLRPTFSPDGRDLAIYPEDLTLLLDPDAAMAAGGRGGLKSVSRTLARDDYVLMAAFHPDGRSIFTYSDEGPRQTDRETGAFAPLADEGQFDVGAAAVEDEDRFDDIDDCNCLACSPDGRWLALSNPWDGVQGLHLYDLRERRWSLLAAEGRAVSSASAAFAADGTLVSCDTDSAVRVWSPERRELLLTVWPTSAPWAAPPQIAPDGERIAVPTPEGPIEVWPWRRVLHHP